MSILDNKIKMPRFLIIFQNLKWEQIGVTKFSDKPVAHDCWLYTQYIPFDINYG